MGPASKFYKIRCFKVHHFLDLTFFFGRGAVKVPYWKHELQKPCFIFVDVIDCSLQGCCKSTLLETKIAKKQCFRLVDVC